MSDPVLPLLVAILVALLAVGGLGAFLPASGRHAIGFAATGISGLGCLLCLMSLLLGNEPAAFELPVGPPGMALHLALDPLAAFYLLFVFLAATAGLAFAAEGPQSDPPATLAGLAVSVAGLGFALLAADGIALSVGLAVGGLALWATGDPGRPRALLLAVTLGAAGLLVAATAILSPADTGPRFDAIRAAVPDPAHAAAALALSLLGAGALAGLVPLHAWFVPAHEAAPDRAAALLSGGVVPVAIYTLVRVVLDLAGPTPPLWWGLPFLLMGAASVVLSAWRSTNAIGVDAVLVASSHRLTGLVTIGIGLVLFGRSADLPNLASLALSAVLLLSAGQAMCGTLMPLCAGAIRQAAGTRRLDRLGGLIHQMPIGSLAVAGGLFGLASLPPGLGFAGSWLLFQSLLEAPRAGGLAPQILLAGLAAVLALSGAIAAASAVRLFGVAFLGRARTPRAAAAEDIPRRSRPALLALAGIVSFLGLLPGVALRLLGAPAIRLLTDTGLGSRASVIGLAPGAESPGYATLPLAALVGLCVGCTLWLMRRRGGAERSGAAWHDGFAPAPAWLPFGDPLTQADGSGFMPDLPRPPMPLVLSGWWPVVRGMAPHAVGLWAVLVVIAALLAMLTVLGGA